MVRTRPWVCRLVRQKQVCKHRRTRKGQPQQGTAAKKARKRAHEPWLLATSLTVAEFSAQEVTALYAQRMPIEETFRDLRVCSESPKHQRQESQVDHLQAGFEFSLAVFP
jgi:hypothetical protein